MTTVGTVNRTLDALALKELAARRGPCLPMFIPDNRPGANAGSRAVLVRDMLGRAEGLFEDNKALKAFATDLLAPLAAFADSEEVEGGGAGLVVFRSPHFLEVFELRGTTGETVAVSSHFTLFPLLERVYAPQRFFILGLSRKHLRLIRFNAGVCEELALPPKVPESLEAAGAFKPPDHDLENRSTAGVSTGSMKAVQFGTLTDREAASEYLYHFLGLVARGLKETLKGAPLLLAGVHEEVSAYRRASKYPGILEAEISGNIESLALEDIARRAAEAAREHYVRAGKNALGQIREMPDRNRVLTGDAHRIVRAAAAGRVHQLCVREDSAVRGPMERELVTAHLAIEDLANAAVVETIRHGGEVFALPQDCLPASNPLAAMLRY